MNESGRKPKKIQPYPLQRVCKNMRINPLKLSIIQSLIAMALAVVSSLPVLVNPFIRRLTWGTDRLTSRTGKSMSTCSNPRKANRHNRSDFKPSWSKTDDKLVFFGVSKIILKSGCGRQRSVSSTPMERGFTRLRMPSTPTSTRR